MIDLTDISQVNKLVEACIKGERKSQKKFYQMFYGKMLASAMRYAENKEEAKDIVHDGFIKVFTNLHKFGFEGSLEGWVKRIVINTAVDAVRKKKNFIVELEENKNYESIIDDHDENIENEQLNKMKVEMIMKLIQKLTPMYKAVFNLYVFEELTHKEIAEQLGINIGTSKSNYSKARRNLIRFIEEYTNEHKH